MNRKTIAVAALALLATSGLASARTVHAKPAADNGPATIAPFKFPGGNDMNDGAPPKVQASADPAKASPRMDPAEAAFETVPFESPYGHAGGLDNVTSYNHPGDNDMDPNLNH